MPSGIKSDFCALVVYSKFKLIKKNAVVPDMAKK
jgi:hypothetical protein